MDKAQRNEEYFGKIFSLIKQVDGLGIAYKRGKFNLSEMRLLGEVLFAERAGKRIISTRLAQRLGVTRAAISQIVNKLEKREIVKRVPDDVDRKIAYIELTEKAKAMYEEEKKLYCAFVGAVVEKMGERNLEEFLRLGEKPIAAVELVRK